MRGELYLRRLRDQLRSLSSKKTYRTYPIQLPSNSGLNKGDLLRLWGGHFKMAPAVEQVDQYVAELIKTMVGSLQGGSVMVVEVTFWDRLNAQQQFLHWFLTAIWIPLLDALANAREKIPLVTVVVVLNANYKLDPVALPAECCCTQLAFDAKKILELPLENWDEAAIYRWLIRFLGLTTEDAEKAAKNIYDGTAGDPGLVLAALEELDQQAAP